MNEQNGSGFRRVGTGNPELDDVLRGGFPAHSINIVMGRPGTGKTILAQQLTFHNADAERPAVYLTTISEPLPKVLTFLQQYDFYDEAKMFGSVLYDDLGDALLEKGPTHLIDVVGELIRTKSPRILVIDSFKAIDDLARDDEELRRVVYRLGAMLSAYDVTTFLVGEYTEPDVSTFPEFALADGIVQLERSSTDNADERYLRVLKLRGSAYREGVHAFRTTSRGLQVYPRLVTPKSPVVYGAHDELVSTGTAGLDELVGGGLWRGSTTVVQGSTGTGKTTLGLAFVLEGVRRGVPSLFLNLQEHPIQLARTIERLGVDYAEACAGGLHLQYESPVELTIDALVVDLFRTIEAEGIERVAIDGLSEIRWATEATERFHDYVYSMVQHFRVHGVTALLTSEVPPRMSRAAGLDSERVSALCDALILLEHPVSSGEAQRTLQVVKVRASKHPLEARPFTIDEAGIHLDGAGQ